MINCCSYVGRELGEGVLHVSAIGAICGCSDLSAQNAFNGDWRRMCSRRSANFSPPAKHVRTVQEAEADQRGFSAGIKPLFPIVLTA